MPYYTGMFRFVKRLGELTILYLYKLEEKYCAREVFIENE